MPYTARMPLWIVYLWLLVGISAQEELLCTNPADLGIILDSSDATITNWPEVLDFANALVEFFNVSPNGSNVGIITYSTDAKVALNFNTFQGDNLTPEDVQDLIGDLKPKGGHRFIDKALKLANEQLFTQAAGMRVHDNDTLKVLIVLTAGKQTTDQGSFTPLREASKLLQDKGIEIYVVGIGSNKEMDVNELTQIAGKQENVLTTERFEDLVTLAEEVSKVACGMKIFEVSKNILDQTAFLCIHFDFSLLLG